MGARWRRILITVTVIAISSAAAAQQQPCLSHICVGDMIAGVPFFYRSSTERSRTQSDQQADIGDAIRRLSAEFPDDSRADAQMLALYDSPSEIDRFELTPSVKQFFLRHGKYCDFFDVWSEFPSESGYRTTITMNPPTPSGSVVVTEILRWFNISPSPCPGRTGSLNVLATGLAPG
jgi:hypothetical protein